LIHYQERKKKSESNHAKVKKEREWCFFSFLFLTARLALSGPIPEKTK